MQIIPTWQLHPLGIGVSTMTRKMQGKHTSLNNIKTQIIPSIFAAHARCHFLPVHKQVMRRTQALVAKLVVLELIHIFLHRQLCRMIAPKAFLAPISRQVWRDGFKRRLEPLSLQLRSHVLDVLWRQFVSETLHLKLWKVFRSIQATVESVWIHQTLTDLRNQVTLTIEGHTQKVALREQMVNWITARKVEFHANIPGSKSLPPPPISLLRHKITIFVPYLIHDFKWNPQPAVSWKALSQCVIRCWVTPKAPVCLNSIIRIALVATNSLVIQRQCSIQIRTRCFRHMNMAI